MPTIYPGYREYINSILYASENLDELTQLETVTDSDGQPLYSGGGFAMVFKMRDTATGQYYALKTFSKEQPGREEAYLQIYQALRCEDSPYLVGFRYLPKELYVSTAGTDQTEFPVLKMDWVDGITLDSYVRRWQNDRNRLVTLSWRFGRMAAWLLSQPFAHGDLKPDNILVREDGTLTLVDYDGMYVPAMQNQSARELGSPDYRHPDRKESDFGPHIDDFALCSLGLSLQAIALRPELLTQYGRKDGLLLGESDYRDLGNSAALQAIMGLGADSILAKLFGLFMLAYGNRGYLPDNAGQYFLQPAPDCAPDFVRTVSNNNNITLKPLTFPVNGVTFRMMPVEAGTFQMGATPEMSEPWDYEKPVHQVTLTRNYYIGETQVTQALWQAVMGNNPSLFQGNDQWPVENVSWDDCQTFIQKLNNLTGKKFRLPTEAEWEFAARGGNKSQHYQYSGSNNLDEVAWYYSNSEHKPHPVAQKKLNELGLYDMSGNVWEWCQDWYADYSDNPQIDPEGPQSGSDRVDRGGSWDGGAGYCRSSFRNIFVPGIQFNNLGLRLVLSE